MRLSKGIPERTVSSCSCGWRPHSGERGRQGTGSPLQEAFVPGSDQNKWSGPTPLGLSQNPKSQELPPHTPSGGWLRTVGRGPAGQGPLPGGMSGSRSPHSAGQRQKRGKRAAQGARLWAFLCASNLTAQPPSQTPHPAEDARQPPPSQPGPRSSPARSCPPRRG